MKINYLPNPVNCYDEKYFQTHVNIVFVLFIHFYICLTKKYKFLTHEYSVNLIEAFQKNILSVKV